jgi:hypothetical protein
MLNQMTLDIDQRLCVTRRSQIQSAISHSIRLTSVELGSRWIRWLVSVTADRKTSRLDGQASTVTMLVQ